MQGYTDTAEVLFSTNRKQSEQAATSQDANSSRTAASRENEHPQTYSTQEKHSSVTKFLITTQLTETCRASFSNATNPSLKELCHHQHCWLRHNGSSSTQTALSAGEVHNTSLKIATRDRSLLTSKTTPCSLAADGFQPPNKFVEVAEFRSKSAEVS